MAHSGPQCTQDGTDVLIVYPPAYHYQQHQYKHSFYLLSPNSLLDFGMAHPFNCQKISRVQLLRIGQPIRVPDLGFDNRYSGPQSSYILTSTPFCFKP